MRLESLTDAAHCLRLHEHEFLHHELESFRQTFPQIFLAVYLGVLPGNLSPGELAFWLLNHAAFHPSDPGRLNEHAALLLIDPVTKVAGMTVGYALDPHVPQRKLAGLLRRIRTPLWHGEFAEAIELAIRSLGKILRHAAHRSPRHREFPPPEPGTDFFSASGIHSLRHAPAEPQLEMQEHHPLPGTSEPGTAP